jgi:hypothetical protein
MGCCLFLEMMAWFFKKGDFLMKKQMNWLVVMIVVFGMVGLACNAVTGGGDEPTAVVSVGDPAATEAANTDDGGALPGGGGEPVGGGAAAPTLNLDPANNFGVHHRPPR